MQGWEDSDAIGVTVRTGVLNEFLFFCKGHCDEVTGGWGICCSPEIRGGRETERPPKSSNNEALRHSQSIPGAEMCLVDLQGKR